MAELELSVQLDGGQAVMHPGDTLSGEIEAIVLEDFECNSLVATCGWKTRGHGNEDGEAIWETTLAWEEDWEGGETRCYPFEIELNSPGPYTYEGEEVSVVWEVEAKGDRSLLSGVTATEDFWLVPTGEESEYRLGDVSLGRGRRELLEPPAEGSWIGVWMALVLGALGVMLLGAALGPWVNLEQVESYIFVGSFGLAGLGALVGGISKGLARLTYEGVTLAVIARAAAPGETVRSRAKVPGYLQSYCRGLELELIRTETGVFTDGERSRERSHTEVVETVTPGSFDPDTPEGQKVTHEASLQLPESAAYSMWSTHNRIEWAVRLKIDAPLWPDWSMKRPIFVRPQSTS